MMFLHVRLLRLMMLFFCLLIITWEKYIYFLNEYYEFSKNMFLFIFLDEYDSYIIVSFVNATLVLSIGETVEEVTDSGFLGTTPTLSCSALGEDALVQVITTKYFKIWKI